MTLVIVGTVVGLLFLAVGSAFIIRGVNKLRSCTETARGMVCEILEHRNNDPEYMNPPTMKTPVIRYRVNGKTYKHKANFSASSLKQSKGDVVVVQYDPQNPRRVLIRGVNKYSSFLYAPVLIFIGLVWIVVSRL